MLTVWGRIVIKYSRKREYKMAIKNVALLGAGAVGSYFIWGLNEKTDIELSLVASGERAERLRSQGLCINDKIYHPTVKTPEEARGADLLIIAVKYGALRSILDDVKTIVTDDTIVLCPMNGVDSEEILSTVIPEKNIIYSIIKIASNRSGNSIRFDGPITKGVYFGEKNSAEISPRMQEILDLFKDNAVAVTAVPDIMRQIWFKFALNMSRNLPQAILGVGVGAYDDSKHVGFIEEKIVQEVVAVAAAEGVDIADRSGLFYSGCQKDARYSTLQDLDNKRHTEIDMFAGTMIRLGTKHNIPVPYCEFCFHSIKALEEKNDGKFDYK